MMQVWVDDPNRALLVAVSVAALSFLGVIFVEETVWSVRKLLGKR